MRGVYASADLMEGSILDILCFVPHILHDLYTTRPVSIPNVHQIKWINTRSLALLSKAYLGCKVVWGVLGMYVPGAGPLKAHHSSL
jgi:hypothetical protein